MRVLEALNILEDAVLESKKRDIDTREVRAALDLLEPHCSSRQVQGFRDNLCPNDRRSGAELEGQQQVLRVYFSDIYCSVRALLKRQITELAMQYAHSKDGIVKVKIDRLTAELAKLPERWVFYVRWAL